MEKLKYDYVIVDTKLVAFQTFHRKQSILKLFDLVYRGLEFNNVDIENTRIVFAHDVDKSKYRQTLWKDYKSHRVEVQNRASEKEQIRRQEFTTKYFKTPDILQYLGTNGIIKDMEADDMVSIIRHLRPTSKILMFSLDLDWLLNVDDKTHLLFFSKNLIYTSKQQVERKLGLSTDLYIHMSGLVGQAKDNIINIKQLGVGRFKKYLLDENGRLKENYGEVVDDLIETRKHGILVNPKAKFKDWRDNYHLNLMLMNSIPIDEVDIEELKDLDDRLDSELPDITYEEFMEKCYHTFNDIPLLDVKYFEQSRK